MPIPSSFRWALPVLLLSAAPAALAQYPTGAVVQSLPRPGDPAELLAQALRTLAVEPGNLAALTAAGHNALVLGDPNAAVGFFGRAQEIAPHDGRVKAGLGSALVELEKPQDALRLFAEASRLGVPDEDLAEDRGLAYDLTGDTRRAQHDYAVVLGAHPENDLVRRRLALSQGISGDKAAAIATLDPLIRKRDIAGWRAQTFVLAMNGDAKGAASITHIMLPQQAEMLQPFLVRLATLSPADKARAVNFGEMPAAGRAYSATELANTGVAPTYATPPRAAARPAPTVAPSPQVATHASDLAPIPASTVARVGPSPALAPRVAVVKPAAAPAVSAPTTAAPATERSAALSSGTTAMPTASSPGPQVMPAAKAPASVPPAATLAQAGPPPAAAASEPDLPTPAPTGHYDLPHDAVRPVGRAAAARPQTVSPTPMPSTPATVAPTVAEQRAAPASVASQQTVGTPVVHVTPRTKPPRMRLAHADENADQSSAPMVDKASDEPTSTRTRGRHATRTASADDDASAKGKTRASATTDDADDSASTRRKGAKAARDTLADADTGGDKVSAKGRKNSRAAVDDAGSDTTSSRKGARGKLAATDDRDEHSAKSRKAVHGKLAAADDSSEETPKSRKAARDRKALQDDDGDKPAKSKRESAKAEPERVFVQVAGGANKDDMDKAWTGLKKKAPDLLKGKTAQTTPVKATNRLLVGPFKSEDEAQVFVNKMAGKGLSGFTVKTSKGQKVEKVDTGQ
ncbi:SPOR domain-containing protein [uncultured Sphingomonas sp.]|uniref:SPOR domain-containing protein n=1 Tax=uncultured Sphingomonas sp. TaxID=158754 RepID=UPI0026253DD1|nr:SPOR domain-containing protein [uncultured Sphingomonas sp.]